MFRSIFDMVRYAVFCWAILSVVSLHASAPISQTVKLPSGLRVTYISDPQVAVSAVGLEVQAGSWQDPKQYPGMAHLVGCLLDRGVTEAGRTCFSFFVPHEELKAALNAFYLSCTQPFTSQEAIEAKCAALEEEESIIRQSDSDRQWRMLQLHAHPSHPFAQAKRGEAKTLATLTPELLSQWKDYYYRPEVMHLIVVSALTKTELETIVNENWAKEKSLQSQVALSKSLLPYTTTDSFAQEAWQGQVSTLESSFSRYSLKLAWEITSDPHSPLLSLASHLSGLLAEESEGSLYAEYAQKGWALSVESRVYPLPSGALVLTCEFEVTPQGFRHDTDIIQGVMESLKRWRLSGIPLYYLEQRQKQLALQILLREKLSASQQVLEVLGLDPQETLLKCSEGTYSTPKWRSLCAQVGPETMHVVKMAPQGVLKIALNSQDSLAGVSYTTTPFSKRQHQKWVNAAPSASERIPPINLWMPESMPKGIASDETLPALEVSEVMQGERGTFTYYALPAESMTGAWRVRWGTALDLTPIDRFYRKLLIEILRVKGEGRVEAAKRAGITTHLLDEEGALCVEVSGYHERLSDYLDTRVKDLVDLEISPEHFLQAKQRLTMFLQETVRTGQWGVESLLDQVYQRQLAFAEQLLLLKNLTLEQFQPYVPRLLRPYFVDVIAVSTPMRRKGEWWSALQKRIEPIMETTGEVDVKQSLHPTEIEMSSQALALQLRAPREGHRVVWVLEVPQECHDSTLELLVPRLREFLSSMLQTEERLVDAMDLDRMEYCGCRLIACTMESDRAEPQELLYRLERCVERFIDKEVLLSESDGCTKGARKEAIINRLRTMPSTALEFCRYISEAMTNQQKDLKWKQHKAEQCAALSTMDYQLQMKSVLSGQNRLRLAFLIQGTKGAKEQEVIYRTVRSWKGLWKLKGS